jgi:hypothetical protein
MNTLLNPILNPVKFHELEPSQVPQYLTKYFDEHPYFDTIDEHQYHQTYCQSWQTSDIIKLQLTSNFAPLTVSLIDSDGRKYYETNMQQVQSGPFPDTAIYEINVSLSTIEEGTYWLQIACGSPVSLTLISEPLYIRETHETSVLLEYKHYQFKDDLIFETGIVLAKRVKGKIRYKSPASVNTLFKDQTNNQTLLDHKGYRVWELIVGDSYGVPDYEIDRISEFFGCSDVWIDGRKFTVADGAKWEEASQEDYPLRGWRIELNEAISRRSKVYENDAVNNQNHYVIAVVDTKGWGFDTGGENQIQDVI